MVQSPPIPSVDHNQTGLLTKASFQEQQTSCLHVPRFDIVYIPRPKGNCPLHPTQRAYVNITKCHNSICLPPLSLLIGPETPSYGEGVSIYGFSGRLLCSSNSHPRYNGAVTTHCGRPLLLGKQRAGQLSSGLGAYPARKDQKKGKV